MVKWVLVSAHWWQVPQHHSVQCIFGASLVLEMSRTSKNSAMRPDVEAAHCQLHWSFKWMTVNMLFVRPSGMIWYDSTGFFTLRAQYPWCSWDKVFNFWSSNIKSFEAWHQHGAVSKEENSHAGETLPNSSHGRPPQGTSACQVAHQF